jgi:hypothetical protein
MTETTLFDTDHLDCEVDLPEEFDGSARISTGGSQ